MKIAFIDTPPLIDWTPASKYTKGGRRFPSLSVTGEKTYNYLALQAISVLRDVQHCGDPLYFDAQVNGWTLDELVEQTVAAAPDIVVLYAEQIKFMVDCAFVQKLKARLPVYVIFTGPLVTALDESCLNRCDGIDCVIRGEFDYAIGEIAQAVREKRTVTAVEGVTLRAPDGGVVRTGGTRHTDNLDALPFPAYDKIDFSHYTESVFLRQPTATMITSRGCPFQCVYCWFPQTIYSHKWRAQSPERVVAEMEYLVQTYGVRELRLDDDMFEVDRKRLLEICRLMRERKLPASFAPQCRPDYLDEEIVIALKSAGCDRVLLGIESGNQDVLDRMKKGMTLADMRAAVGLLKKHAIDIHNCFTIGYPWDTRETIQQTIDFAIELNAEFCQFSIATPLPGTEYFQYVKEQGYLVTDDFSQYDGFCQAVVQYPHLSRSEITAFELEAYRRYFLRFGYAWMMVRRMFRSSAHFRQTLRFARAFWRRKVAGWI